MRSNFFILIFALFISTLFGQEKVGRNAYLDSLFRVAFVNDIASNYKANSEIYNLLLDTIPTFEAIDKHYYLGMTFSEMSISFDPILDSSIVHENLNKAKRHSSFGHYDDLDYFINFHEAQFLSAHKRYDESIEYYRQALNYAFLLDNIDHVSMAISQVISHYMYETNADSINKYINKLEVYSRLKPDSLLKANLFHFKAINPTQTKQDSVEYFFNKSIDFCPGSNLKMNNINISAYIDFLEHNKRFEEAFELGKRVLSNVQQELYLNITKHSISIDKAKKEFESKVKLKNIEIENLQLEEKARDQLKLNSLIIIFLIFLIIVAFILFRNLKKQKLLSLQLDRNNKLLKEGKENAEDLAKLKSQFSETISHELRTPLHGIIGLTSLLISDERYRLSSQGKKYLDSLKFSSDYLLNLVNDVLQISKIDANEIILDEVPFNIYVLIQNLKSTFSSLIDRNNNVFDVKIDKNIPNALLGDPIRLSQIIINLVGNALKFTKYGKVTLEIKLLNESNKRVKLYVGIEDTGKGIPLSKQKQIFDKFTQINNSSSNQQGTGLGLSIVKELLILFDSKIELKSEENVGSLFSFEIELKVGNQNISEESLLVEEMPDQEDKKTILLVDDNEINKIVTVKILERNNYLVETCSNGIEAIEFANSKDYDLILMDYHMPKMNGDKSAEVIRKHDDETPIILLSASNLKNEWSRFVEIGFDDFIVKPFDQLDFIQKVYKYTKGTES